MSKKTNYIFVGLGNPGEEYVQSRHSFGRMILLSLAQKPVEGMTIGDWRFDKKMKAQLAGGRGAKNKFQLLLPENMMNNSGGCIKPLIKSKKEAGDVVVIHDDIDLPLGTVKLSYHRGSGGHRGVESIIKALKTNEFVRLRLGVAPTMPSGKIKKPGSDKIINFIIGNFKPSEEGEVKKVIKKAKKIVESLVEVGLDKTMNLYNKT
ncbi:MAG: aminoacyl-tRNA hydrolase [Candidatus Paceibacterota bacterium]|jgi:PTH1 family peptidyl-tRNA hydrolase